MLSASRCRKNLFRNIKYQVILEVFKSNHLQAYEKEYWRLSSYKRIIRKDHQNFLFQKTEISYHKSSLCKKDGKIFCNKRVMVKAGIPSSISKETVHRLLPMKNLKWTHFRRKELCPKMTWNWDFSLLKKLIENLQLPTTTKYEIIRKLLLEIVEFNLLKSEHYYQEQNLQMISYLFNKFQRSRW